MANALFIARAILTTHLHHIILGFPWWKIKRRNEFARIFAACQTLVMPVYATASKVSRPSKKLPLVSSPSLPLVSSPLISPQFVLHRTQGAPRSIGDTAALSSRSSGAETSLRSGSPKRPSSCRESLGDADALCAASQRQGLEVVGLNPT